MIKIVQLISSINLGGAENVAFSIVENNNKNFDFTLVELFRSNTNYANKKRNKLLEVGIQMYSLTNIEHRIGLLYASFKLFLFILRRDPHIVHSHTDLPDFVLSTVLRLLTLIGRKKPIIIRTIHNTELWPSHKLTGYFTEKGFNKDYVIGVSKSALNSYNDLRIQYKLSPSPYQGVIYNGCKLPIIQPFPFTIDNAKINMCFCGRFEFQKGIDLLIKIIPEINKDYFTKFNFYFIGQGSFINEVLNLKNKWENVYVFPPIQTISSVLNVFDFLLVPSRFEGLGLISIEASFSRVPVIATNVAGLNETLPYEWPLFFDFNESTQLLNIFHNIVENKYDLNKVKNDAFEFVNKNFKEQDMIDSYHELYVRTNDIRIN